MPEVTLDLSNLNLEWEVIAHSLQTGGLPESLKPEHFAAEKTQWIAGKLAALGMSCSIPLMVSELHREGKSESIPEWESLLGRLMNQRVAEESIPDAVTRIRELATGRRLANLLTQTGGIADNLKRQKVGDAVRTLENFLFAEHSMQGVVAEGSFVHDEVKLLASIDAARRNEEFRGCPTYIPQLDEVIYGLLPGELGLLAGGTGEGKSIGLLDIGMRNWEWGGKNVIGFTIEMEKEAQEFRQLSWALGIDSSAFRQPGGISESQRQQVKNFFELKRSKENIFYWVDIPENVNAAQIERKLIQAERKWRKEFDIVLIDYMGIMSPIGSFRARTDWDAQAEIAWNVHNLARKTHKVVWSAAQKKENLSDKEKLKGGLKSIGLSYLIAQPVDICLVFVDHTLEGFMEVNVAKGRGTKKDRVKLKPDLRYSRIQRIELDPIQNSWAQIRAASLGV